LKQRACHLQGRFPGQNGTHPHPVWHTGMEVWQIVTGENDSPTRKVGTMLETAYSLPAELRIVC
jgi:hypothetical protein